MKSQVQHKLILDGSIDSEHTCAKLSPLTSYRKSQPTTIVLLRGIMQGKKETLHECINRFTKVVVAVGDSDESFM